MITNEIYFFENQSSVSTSDFLYNVNDGTLILQVDGNVSNLELSVLGNTDLVDDDFVTLKTINASDYSMGDKITSTGIYWIDINGIRKIKLNLSKITGSVNVKAITKRGLTTDLVARAMAANASGGGSYTLPVASASTLGGIKVGENLTITEDGILSATGGEVGIPEAPIDDILYGRKNGTWDKIPDSINIYKTITDSDVPSNNTVILNIDEIKEGDCIVIKRSNVGANTFVKFNENSFASLTLSSGIYQFVYINGNNVYIIGNNRIGIYYYNGSLNISQSNEYNFALDEVRNIVYKNRDNTIYGTITFTTTPKFTKAPTTDEEATNKKYVDALPTTYSGYDATKTQVLKNINGTLTWVDE